MDDPTRPSPASAPPGERLLRAAPLLLAAALLVFFGEALIAGRVPALRDLVCDFVPWREFAARALEAGEIPLWNAHSRCGQPFLANPQSAVLYPPHLLFVILPTPLALTASLALHTALLLGGGYALARRWGLERAPALLAAAGLGFGTYPVAMMEFLSSFTTVAWLPVICLAADRLVAAAASGSATTAGRLRRCARPTALLALLLAVQTLAGHPQSLLQCVTLVVAYTAVRGAVAERAGSAVVALCGLAVAGVVALGLSAPQLLPTLELLPLSTRSAGIDLGTAEASVHPSHLLTLVLPGLFGGPGYAGEWWNDEVYEYWASTSYVGVGAILFLAFLPLLWTRRGPDRAGRAQRALAVLFGCVAVVGLLLAFGDRTPLYPLVFGNVPLLDRFRWPGKLLHWVAFSLPFLGALGFQAALRAPRRWLIGVLIGGGLLWLTAVLLYATGFAIPSGSDAAARRVAAVRGSFAWLVVVLGVSLGGIALLATARLRAAGVALLALAALADPAVVSRATLPFLDAGVYRATPDWVDEYREAPAGRVHGIYQKAQMLLYGTRDPSLLLWARDAAVGEALLPLGVDRTWGFGQLPLRRWAEAWTMLDDPALDARARQRLADVMNVRFVVHGPRFDEQTLLAREWPALRFAPQPGCAPRAQVVGSWEVAADADEALRRLLGGADAVLHAEGREPPPTRGAGTGRAGAVTSLSYDWNRVTVDVETEREALLVLADAWHPGWTARVDGAEVPVLHANWLFRGVRLPAGARRVEMTYVDPGFRRGIVVALVAAVLLVLLALVRRRPPA